MKKYYKYIVWVNGGSEGEFVTPCKAIRKAKKYLTTNRLKDRDAGPELWQMLSVMIEKVEVTEEEYREVKEEEDYM